MEQTQPKKQYHVHYGPAGGRTRVDFDELWRYKDLIWLFVKRDFTVLYKQTVLGPAWILINPLLSMAMYTVMFGTIANLSTGGVPQPLFYLAGTAVWTFFSILHQQGVGHIYHQLQHLQQSVFSAAGHAHFHNAVRVHQLPGAVRHVLLPAVVLRGARRGGPQLGGYAAAASHRAAGGHAGHGLGIIMSSVTTRYRDLIVVVNLGVQLWMYATPIVYPASMVMDQYPHARRPVHRQPDHAHRGDTSAPPASGHGERSVWPTCRCRWA